MYEKEIIYLSNKTFYRKPFPLRSKVFGKFLVKDDDGLAKNIYTIDNSSSFGLG